MDLEIVLAKFTAPGPIETRADLYAALEELLVIMATSREDIPLLLDILINGIQGLLEAILTSSTHHAFTFRNRVTKALRKSLATSTPIFRACADKLGAFLITIPPHIALERTVMEDYNAYTAATVDLESAEADYHGAKAGPQLGPTSPTKPGKREPRHTRTTSTSRVSSTKDTYETASKAKSSASSGPAVITNLPKLLTSEIEEFAIDNLFKTITPGIPPTSGKIVPSGPVSSTPATAGINQKPVLSSPGSGTSSPLHYLSLKHEDIAKYLNLSTKPKSGNWPVVVSQRGIRRLREYIAEKKDVFLRIEKKIRQLSVGFFPPQNKTKLLREDFVIPIYTADLGDGLRLIYHIDFGAPTVTGKESQFIRVFGLFHESEVDVKFWEFVAVQLARRGQEYIERCKDRGETRIRFKGIETVPPTVSSPLDTSRWNEEGADMEVDESHLLELHRILSLEKFVPLSRNFFEAIQKFDEHSFMFAVSSPEYRVITHPSSCLVLGRSGTGKTTCMLFRMTVLDMDTKDSERPPRQMFVTQSRTLAMKVRKYWTQLSQAEKNEAIISPGTLKLSLSLVDMDESAEDTGVFKLPPKFSELKDSDFPVFLTYNQLCTLLEADYGLHFHPSTTTTTFFTVRGTRQQGLIRQPLITFEYFNANIWPRMDETLKKGLHPALVYSEIISVIKGSEVSRSFPKYFLDRQAYESQSNRTHFGDSTERSRIYTLFEAYLKLRPPGSYDAADSLIGEVEARGIPGNPIDYLYVDEAQDHLILEAAFIIVRNEIAAQKLQENLQEVDGTPVVLTLYDSKGLEYDDVLLYDFFHDSPATATDWRAMHHAELREKPFDERRHAILRTELKALYVGLTRAKARVWFWDRSIKGIDLEILLTALKLATTHDTSRPVPQLGVLSSSHEWSNRAQQYFSKGLFFKAALAFKNADMNWWERVAIAYGDRQVAMRLPQQHIGLQSAFTKVAREFEHLAESPDGVDNPTTRCHLFLNAGECYATVLNYAASARAFVRCEKYTEAAYNYRMAGCFDEAIGVINQYPVNPDVAESITYTAKIVYAKERDEASLHKARNLFASEDEFLEFLKDHDFEYQMAIFLGSLRKYERAGDIYREAEDYSSAIRQFRRATAASAHQKAYACLWEGLRANISFATGYGRTSKQLSQLFKLSREMGLPEDEEDEVHLLEALSLNDPERLKEYGLRYLSSGNSFHALLALDAWASSNAIQALPSASGVEAAEILNICLKFCAVVNNTARMPNILDSQAALNLFCISSARTTDRRRSESVSVKSHSFAYRSLKQAAGNRKRASNRAVTNIHSKHDVQSEIMRGLGVRLNKFIDRVEELAQNSRAYELCIPFVTSGLCNDEGAGLCWKEHPSETELTVPQFNSRFRLHILTIALLAQPRHQQSNAERTNQAVLQRTWLDRLFKLCYPSTDKSGNLSDVVPSLIPEYKQAMRFVNSCLSSAFRSLHPATQSEDFISATLRTSLLRMTFDYAPAMSDLGRSQWVLNQGIAAGRRPTNPTEQRYLVSVALAWFAKNTLYRTNSGVHFLEIVAGGDVSLDVEVAIAFVEEVCAHFMFNWDAHHPDESYGLYVEGALLERPESYSGRYQGLLRLSRCLALVGHNIPQLRHKVISIFRGMGNSCSDLQLFTSSVTWVDVARALKSTSSSLDDLLSIKWKQETSADEYGVKTIFCPDDQMLLDELSHVSPEIVAPSTDTNAEEDMIASEPVLIEPIPDIEEQPSPEATEDSVAPRMDTEHHQRSAKVIQAFFLRYYQIRADDSIAAAFEDAAKRRISTTPSNPPSRFLLLCLRGPLPHVVEFLEKLKTMAQNEVSALNKRLTKEENLDELSREVRRIRNDSKKMIKDLQPSSDFYFGIKSKHPASVSDIVEKVKSIPPLVQSLRRFLEIPEDIDYELGVEPLLSDRVPRA
ncbi:hypothetical protein FRC00_006484 [Tulasnella sp. 408]|nr:hypothetical protein FRC00_006484 [Tulasnella sp. 408]